MIGFIGLGIMGVRMANNLLKAGNEVVVYNRSLEKAAPLQENGALLAESIEDLAIRSNVIFTMLSTPEVVEEVALSGMLDAMKPGSIWVDCSTVDPLFSRKMAKAAADRGIRFVDAPVSGSKVPAETAQLIFLVGGEKADVEEVTPFLNSMGKAVLHQGVVGQGAAMKMVVNLVLGHAMAAYSEGILLGEAYGFSKVHVIETLLGVPVTAPVLSAKTEKILTNNFEADFPLEHMHKDLHLATQSAYENQIVLPLTNAAKELYALAKKNGYGKEDFASVMKILHQ